jgi:transcriptional regulator with PAS, ATPase and Fis domain
MSALRIGTRVETEINLEQFLGQVEKELIARAIKQAKDNKTKAAKLLGISRPKLLRRLQHFELDASEAKDGNSDQLDPSVFEELDS